MIDPIKAAEFLTTLKARLKWDKKRPGEISDRFFILPGAFGTVRLTEYISGEVELVYEGTDYCPDCGRGEYYSGEEALDFLEKATKEATNV